MTPSSLYVHVPFCARACPYCDFDFVVDARPDVKAFLAGLEADVQRRGEVGSALGTVYFGGGTPSVLGPPGLTELVAWVRERFDCTAVREWTVELNPEHVDASLVAALVDSGVDRVSLGVQSLAPAGLTVLGRAHDARGALEALELAAKAGLRVSADLIVGWPGQRSVDAEVAALRDAGVEHVSVYALTIEEGTPWVKLVERGTRTMPDPEAQADALLGVEVALVKAGFGHYEVASYARTDAARSQHNLAYWTWNDYVGLGPSAASARYVDGGVKRRQNPRGLSAWVGGDSASEEILSPIQAAAEGLWLGLRVLSGLDVRAFLDRFPAASRAWIAAKTARQRSLGNLVWTDDGAVLNVAEGRWLFHDDIAAELLLLK